MIRLSTRRRNRIDPADTGALSDLAFLLIIFFIVIAVFNVNSGFLLGLPDKNAVMTVFTDDLMRVEITEGGTYLVDQTELDREGLSRAILARRRRQPNLTLVASVHPESRYQALVTLVELARINDVDNFSFSMGGGAGTDNRIGGTGANSGAAPGTGASGGGP